MAFTEDLRTEREMAATPERVWAVLADFDDFDAWNPFIVKIEGEPTVGSTLRVRLQPPGGKGVTLRPVVTTSEPRRSLSWLGRLGMRGVFDGAHRFDLQPLANGGTRFVQSEHFTGVLVPLLRRSLRKRTLSGFHAMNRALAQRAEAVA